MISGAVVDASDEVVRQSLDGTIGDAQCFCWAAISQYERRRHFLESHTARDHGQHHADMHTLLLLAHEAVSHADRVSELLDRLGEPSELPPDNHTRTRLAEARNLLAEHRDERVLFWRLTGRHTPHVEDVYRRLGVALPNGTIDAEQYSDIGAMWGTVGGLFSLPDLREQLRALETRLDELGRQHRPSQA